MNEPIFKEHAMNLSAQLLDEGKILAIGYLDEKMAGDLIAAMLYLDAMDSEPITLYIDLSGGIETEILSVFDVMRHLRCSVETICVGKAHGIAALLLAGGEKGKRKAYANSEIMLTQVGREKTFGQASDIELETAHLLEQKKRINHLFASLCNRSEEQIGADMERKYWLFSEQALEYGLIDQIIE